MDLRASLLKACEILTPTAEIAVAGTADEVISGASVRRARYYRYRQRWANDRSTIQ
jgi:hypothetical protein